MRFSGCIAIGVTLAACNGAEGAVVASPVSARVKSEAPVEPETPRDTSGGWAVATRTPSVAEAEPGRDAREIAFAAACGGEDAALTRVARDIAAARAHGLGAPEADAIVQKLRVAGDPHVRPRLFVASGRSPIDEKKLRPELEKRGGPGASGPSLCGISIVPTAHGGEVFVALRVDALADLAPLPTRSRTGEWLTLEARLHVAARSAKLVVLGPHGSPRTVPTALDPVTGIARARFALDQPGAFTVQLVADVAEGPRPVLEARVFADTTPPASGEEPPAPGEEAAGATDDDAALTRMIGALRTFEGASSLARDAKLDALARAHAEHMRDGRSVAHDLGDGDFRQRFEAEGTIDARAVGENVAHAPTLQLAHRALHASPSHRINLLRADYTHIGIGIARAGDGSVYVCETVASARPSHADR